MLFKYVLICLACTGMPAVQYAQPPKTAIKSTITQFFDGMQKRDTALMRDACAPAPVLQTYRADRNGQWGVVTEDFEEFLAFIGTPSDDAFREEIKFANIEAESDIATVWTPYRFYHNGKLSHCGTNAFQLIRQGKKWKIQYILDTRRKKGCK